MSVMTDFPERITVGTEVYLGEGSYQAQEIASLRQHNRGLIVRFEGFTDRDQLDILRNTAVFIKKGDIPALEDGEYYLHQFIGLNVITDEGLELGMIRGIIETGANSVFIVVPEDGKEVLLPDIDDVVLNVDIDAQQILVHLIDGLIPD